MSDTIKAGDRVKFVISAGIAELTFTGTVLKTEKGYVFVKMRMDDGAILDVKVLTATCEKV